jgi:simple sugar transport system permease protein/ribose transport system permease protein
MLMANGFPWPIAVILMIVIGMGFGLVNGLLVAKLKAVSLIETLAMNTTLTGLVMAITKGRSIVGFPDAFKFIGQGTIGPVPVLPFILVIVYYVLHVIWSKTTFGRSLFAVGGNSNTAFVSGISVERIKIYAFVVSGTLAGLSGFLLSSYMGAVTTTFGKVYQMDSIAAAVIGGISLTGGKGSIIGVLGGVLLLTVIQVGLQVLGISPYYVEMAGGLMILLAVLIDAIRQKYER